VLIGPALATILVLGVGAGEAFAFDAATFVLSALLLRRVRPRARGASVEAVETSPESVVRSLRSGWREVRSRAWVWVTILAFTGVVLCVYAQWYALAPVIARDVYGGAKVFGLLESVAGAGAVCGALVALVWRPARPLRAGLLLVLAWPVQDAMFAGGAPLALVVLGALATGFGFSLFGIWWETALARHIPARALSRVSAWDWMGSLALLPLGFLVAGPLASTFGAQPVLGVGCVIGVALLVIAVTQRSVRELGGEPDAASAEDVPRDVGVEARGEAEVTHIDPLVGAVHEGSRLEKAHVALREEAVRGAVRERGAEPARVRERREDGRHRLGA